MNHQPVQNEPICAAFTAAILLTGSVHAAEAALLCVIRSAGAGELSGAELQNKVAVWAIGSRGSEPRRSPEELARVSRLLPAELRNVLLLPRNLRYCFVLRLLMTLPREMCARLLNRESAAIERDTCLAARAVARIAQRGKCVPRQRVHRSESQVLVA
jgi:hypothetical protein